MIIDYGNAPILVPPSEIIPETYQDDVAELFDVWASVAPRNDMLSRYYRMHNAIKPLGISVPSEVESKLAPVCGWASKAVRARTSRTDFQGFVRANGSSDDVLDELVRENDMRSLHSRLCVSKYVYGLAAYTVMAGGIGQPPVVVRGYSARQCAVIWDKDAGRLKCGIVLSDVDSDGNPLRYTAHFSDAVLSIWRTVGAYDWHCDVMPHAMGRPLMDVIVNDPDQDRPLGHSVLTPEVLDIVDTALRDLARQEIAEEFYAFPQRYLLGVARDFFTGTGSVADDADAIDDAEDGFPADDCDTSSTTDGDTGTISYNKAVSEMQKLRMYMGTWLAITRDEDGEVPTVGQFDAPDPSAFSAAFESDAQRFSGATNVPLAELGVLSNNYTSSDALNATNDPLCLEVEAGNRFDAHVLESVARMMLAIDRETSLDALGGNGNVQAVFADPSMPTIASRADAWSKLASVDTSIIGTRVFYEGVGLSEATIDRLENEKHRQSVTNALLSLAGASATASQPNATQAATQAAHGAETDTQAESEPVVE